MPRSKALNTYPAAYWELVERCAIGTQQFDHPVADVKKGLSLQGSFYAFRSALRRELDIAFAQPSLYDPAVVAKLRATLEFAEKTVCWLTRDPPIVHYTSASNTPHAQELAGILGHGVSAKEAHEQDIKASQAELLKKLQEEQ